MKKLLFISLFVFCICKANSQKSSKNYSEEEDEKVLCGGVERWSVKVLTDAAATSVNFTPIGTTIYNLVNIVTPTPSSSMPRYAGIEDKTYSVTCTITIKKAETDNDYHLVLSDGVHTLIGEIPDPACSAAASSPHVNQYIAARNFINANIASGNVFNVNIPPVVVYGVAFIDPPHGQTGAAPNNLEIHPILDIHFASTTNIKETSNILNVSIFPNPVSDKLNLQINSVLEDLNNCEFKIFNAQGSLVKIISLPKSNKNLETILPIDELSSGMYIYRITKNHSPLYEGKFVKN